MVTLPLVPQQTHNQFLWRWRQCRFYHSVKSSWSVNIIMMFIVTDILKGKGGSCKLINVHETFIDMLSCPLYICIFLSKELYLSCLQMCALYEHSESELDTSSSCLKSRLPWWLGGQFLWRSPVVTLDEALMLLCHWLFHMLRSICYWSKIAISIDCDVMDYFTSCSQSFVRQNRTVLRYRGHASWTIYWTISGIPFVIQTPETSWNCTLLTSC